MAEPMITDLLKYSGLQLAAEALLFDETSQKIKVDIVRALQAGNGRSSVFTQPQAEDFNKLWQVVDQCANTRTGFSGTLFKARDTVEALGIHKDDLVVSFRSTEFVDDSARDSEGTDKLEIAKGGFALGQIADMEAWYAKLTQSGGPLEGKRFAVTGYSLGAHLATVFNLLHGKDIDQVVTFNGAGIGEIGRGTLAGMVELFQSLLKQSGTIQQSGAEENPDGLKSLFQSEAGQRAYLKLREALMASNGILTTSMKDLVANEVSKIESESWQWLEDRDLLIGENGALTRALDIQKYAADVTNLSSGDETPSPKKVDSKEIAAAGLDYQLAVLTTQKEFKTKGSSFAGDAKDIIKSGGLIKKYGAPRLDNQFDVVGWEFSAEKPIAIVAHSLWHYGTDTKIFIEDQPNWRGGILGTALSASLAAGGYRLLVNNFAKKDFGDDHSLVLLVDSLNIQNVLLQLVPTAMRAPLDETLKTILKNASWRKAKEGELIFGDEQGKAEGDVLENVVNALADFILGPQLKSGRLNGNPEGNTWALVQAPANSNYSAREDLYTKLAEITGATGNAVYQQLAGKLKLAASGGNMAAAARKDFGAFAALYSLSPFAFSIGDTASVEALGAAWKEIFTDWRQDKEALNDASNPRGLNISSLWFDDRAAFLERKNWFNANNIDPSGPAAANTKYQADKILWMDVASDYTITAGVMNQDSRRYYFGDQADNAYSGLAGDDHLYGGRGDDTLNGMGGNDYLEGNAGDDRLDGGDANDILSGGKGDDVLIGGAGEDSYIINTGDGKDTIVDRDRSILIHNGKRFAGYFEKDAVSGDFVSVTDSRVTIQIHSPAKLDFGDGDAVTFQELTTPDLVNQGLTWVHVENFKAAEGDVRTIVGDLEATGAYDDLGNIITSGGAPAPDRPDLLAGSGNRDVILSKGGNDIVNAREGDDEVDGGSGRDILSGGAGNDVLVGGSGGDVIYGGAGDDRLYVHDKADASTVLGETGPGNGEAEMLVGGEGDDELVGGDGTDELFGGAGNDVLLGGAGNDNLSGDLNAEVIDVVAQKATVDWQVERTLEVANHIYQLKYGRTVLLSNPSGGGADLLYGGAGDDWMFGGAGDDYLDGGTGEDLLWGEAGNDLLEGGEGNDFLNGDSPYELAGVEPQTAVAGGDDWLFGGAGDDQLFGNGGEDTLVGGAGNDRLLGDFAANEADLGMLSGNDYLEGNDGDDQLWGGGADDTLLGGDGADYLEGDLEGLNTAFHGNDDLDGGAGDDLLYGQGGDDTLRGSRGNDFLSGGAGNDTYCFDVGDGEDTVADTAGQNQIRFGEGISASQIFAFEREEYPGYLFVNYGASATITVQGDYAHAFSRVTYGDGSSETWSAFISHALDAGRDMQGTAGDDHIIGGSGGDTIAGAEGNDVIEGGGGDDTLRAGGGDDQLVGGAGDDMLDGGPGADVLFGRAGHDTYVLEVGSGHDAIDDAAGFNTIQFGHGIDVSSIAASIGQAPNGADYLVVNYAAGDEVGVKINPTGGIAAYHFSDGEVLDREAVESLTYRSTRRLLGDANSQSLSGASGVDVILARSGDDTVYANDGDDYLSGGGGNDRLFGEDGNDVLSGGRGDDLLVGGLGHDTYVFRPGDGHDTIQKQVVLAGDGSGIIYDRVADTIRLEFLPAQTTLLAPVYGIPGIGGSFRFLFDTGDTLTIQDGQFNLNGSVPVDRIEFMDGTAWSLDELQSRKIVVSPGDIVGTAGADHLEGGAGIDHINGFGGDDTINGLGESDSLAGWAGSDVLRGGDGDDVLRGDGYTDTDIDPLQQGDDTLDGGAGDDELVGGGGGDTLIGGAGDDRLSGGAGGDIYVYNHGDGNDLIIDRAEPFIRNVLQLTDISFDDIGIGRISGGNLAISLKDGSGQISLQNWFDMRDSGLAVVDEINFAGGVSISSIDIDRLALESYRIRGTDDADALAGDDFAHEYAGGKGDDRIRGGIERDTYLFAAGDGRDTVSDRGGVNTVYFGSGIAAEEIRVFVEISSAGPVTKIQYGLNDVISIAAAADEVGKLFSTFRFSNGIQLAYEDLVYQSGGLNISVAGDAPASLIGSFYQENLFGGAGNDYLNGGHGSDFLAGGRGDDIIDPRDIGITSFIPAQNENRNLLPDNDILFFAAGDGNDTVVYKNHYRGVDAIVFGDGVAASDIQISLINSTPETLYHYYIGEGIGFDSFADTAQLSAQNDDWWSHSRYTTPYQNYLAGGNVREERHTFRNTYQIDYGDHDSITVTFDDAIPIQRIFFAGGLHLQQEDLSRIAGRNYWTLDGVRQQAPVPRYSGNGLNHALDSRAFDIPIGDGYPFLAANDAGLSRYDGSESGLVLGDYDEFLFDINSFSVATAGINTTASGQMIGTAFADAIQGDVSDDRLFGRNGDDFLSGGEGADVLSGGRGNDVLAGGAGGDIYRYALTDGSDRIVEALSDAGVDVIEFGAGITPEALTVGVDAAGELVIRLGAESGGQIVLGGFDRYQPAGTGSIELFRFADQSELSYAALIARGFTITADHGFNTLLGTGVNDVILGGSGFNAYDGLAGDDLLVGGDGYNQFNFVGRWGRDTVVDSGLSHDVDGDAVVIGLSVSETYVLRDGDDLLVGRRGGEDSIRFKDIATTPSKIGGLGFSDAYISLAELKVMAELKQAPPALSIPLEDMTKDLKAGGNVEWFFQIPASNFTDYYPGDALAFRAALADGGALPSWLSFDAPTATFSGTPNFIDRGTYSITVTAIDRGNSAVMDMFDLTVVGQDDAPILMMPAGTWSVAADDSWQFQISPDAFLDIDQFWGDTLSYSAELSDGSALPAWLTFDPVTQKLSAKPGNAETGRYGIKLIATDMDGLSAADVLELTVEPSFQILNGAAGDDYLTSGTGDDTLSGGAGNDYLLGGAGNDRYLFNPGDGVDHIVDWSGHNTIAFGEGITPDALTLDLGSLLLHVGGGGDAIHIDHFDRTNVYATPSIVEFYFSDGSSITCAQLLERGFDLAGTDGNDLQLGTSVVDRIFGMAGDDTLDGGAGDDQLVGGSGSDRYVFGQHYGHDTIYAWNSLESDVDEIVLKCSPTDIAVLRVWGDLVVTLPESGDSLTISNFASFENRITRVGFDDATSWSFDTLVANAVTVNHAPLLQNPLADQVADEDSPFNFTFAVNTAAWLDTFADTDFGDSLTFQASGPDGAGLPAWLTFDVLTQRFSGTPQNADVGAVALTVTATDSAGASATDTFNLTVTNTDDTPILVNPIPDQAATEDVAFSYVVPANSFADDDLGDTLTYRATRADGSALPGWLGFNADTLTLSGTPLNADVGTLRIQVEAVDGAGASITDTFELTVANTNDAPVATDDSIAATENAITANLVALLAQNDSDEDVGDTRLITAIDTAATRGAVSFNAAAQTLIYAAQGAAFDALSAGATMNDSFRYTLSDAAGASATATVTLTVSGVNDAPLLNVQTPNQATITGSAFTLTLAANTFADVDASDTLTLSARLATGAALPAWLTFNPGSGTLAGIAGAADAGIYSISVLATDSGNLSVADTFTLTVSNPAGLTLTGTAANDTLSGGAGNDTLDGRGGSDRLLGNGGSDTLIYFADGLWTASYVAYNAGSPGNAGSGKFATIAGKNRSFDVFDGGAGEDVINGTANDDALFLDDSFSPFPGAAGARIANVERVNAGAGNDVVDFTSNRFAYGNVTIDGGDGNDVLWASLGNDLLFGGAGNDDLFGGAGQDYLNGGAGNDTLNGDRGNDLLEGAAGDDMLNDTFANNLFYAREGNDQITGGSGNELFIGGAGDDSLLTGTGADVIAFNRGDGHDRIAKSAPQDNTLSLGGGIRYSDLYLQKQGNNLILQTAVNEDITLTDWYASSANRSVGNLQIIVEASADYLAGGSDTLRDNKIERFDFKAIAQRFDQALAAAPATANKWAVMNVLLDTHLGAGSDSEALGGDLAYQYGRTGSLAGIGITSAQNVLAATQFGSAAQSLQAFSGLQEGLVKLG